MSRPGQNISSSDAVQSHPRIFEKNRYVYPVLSRRAKGISIGINLNPDRLCNFDCVYCQVDRTRPSPIQDVDREMIRRELKSLLADVRSGDLFRHPKFAGAPDGWKRLNDVAFSGDGEPTTYPGFQEIVRDVVGVLRKSGVGGAKLVLITNASQLGRPDVREALNLMDAANGEVWAKLDAGTEEYYKTVCRTQVRFDAVIKNILETSLERPLVIQSCFMRLHGLGPDDAEIGAYIERLKEFIQGGGKIREVQVYTIARKPAERFVSTLGDAEVDHIVGRVKGESALPATGYYSHP